MNVRRRRPVRSSFLVLVIFTACLFACNEHDLSIVSYNVGNLFDGADDGTEYREYDPGRSPWSEGLFRKRLTLTAGLIRRAAPGGPDIVLLQEVENARVLDELNVLLGYPCLAAPRRPRADGLPETMTVRRPGTAPRRPPATTVGILSRFPLSRLTVYELPEHGGEPVREILEATVETGGEMMVLFNNHWKSKIGNARLTEKARLKASGLLLERVRAARARAPDATIVIAGDLNERHNEYALVRGAWQTALILETEKVPDDFYADSLVLSGAPESCGVFEDRVVAYEPWIGHRGTPAGSYFHRGWETIDHLLLVPGPPPGRAVDFRVCCEPDLLHPRTGRPLAWDRKSPDRGYSDHLPIVLTFKR